MLDHRSSIYDNVPDDQQLSGSEGGSGGSVSDADRIGEESEVRLFHWYLYLILCLYVSNGTSRSSNTVFVRSSNPIHDDCPHDFSTLQNSAGINLFLKLSFFILHTSSSISHADNATS